jgi:LAGLIDADG endonuclease
MRQVRSISRKGWMLNIAGFVDGEGSFHVAVQRIASTVAGWQFVRAFHVSQNEEVVRSWT